MSKSQKKNKAKKWHKWLGVLFAFFALIFAISGIILNHRGALSKVDVPRRYLPDYLTIENWNQSSIKTTLNIGGDSIIMYGSSGIWLTDKRHTFVERYEDGIKQGADNRNIAKIVKTHNGDIFALTTFDLYRFDKQRQSWICCSSLIDTHERLSDIAASPDTLVIASRSEIFYSTYPYNVFTKSTIKAPSDYNGKVSLFRTIWRLHSGELFGEIGKIIVDILGIVTILLSITGIIIFLFPKIVRYLKKRGKRVTIYISTLRPSYKIHGKLGYWLAALLLILFASGTFLRPPLLIAIIRSDVAPIPYTTLDSENAWNDRLRCINYDTLQKEWLIYTSEGFYAMPDLKSIPDKIVSAPKVSVMGVNIMQQVHQNSWIVGSFDGLVLWDRINGYCVDYITKQPLMPKPPGPPNQHLAVTGYSNDFLASDIAFGYTFGAKYINRNGNFISMPQIGNRDKISLWHLALEVHTGRIYQPIIGLFSDMFVFISGLVLIIITFSGLIIVRKTYPKGN